MNLLDEIIKLKSGKTKVIYILKKDLEKQTLEHYANEPIDNLYKP